MKVLVKKPRGLKAESIENIQGAPQGRKAIESDRFLTIFRFSKGYGHILQIQRGKEGRMRSMMVYYLRCFNTLHNIQPEEDYGFESKYYGQL